MAGDLARGPYSFLRSASLVGDICLGVLWNIPVLIQGLPHSLEVWLPCAPFLLLSELTYK